MLLRMLLSMCHECGYQDDYIQKLELSPYKEKMYVVSFVCPVCGHKSSVVASESDINDLFSK